ncbi:MAG: pseudouridine synthase [Planctomyces sp.]|nr:pseudouridine synthase [Planctomyces sp.]
MNTPKTSMRLQKFLAAAGIDSRRNCEEYIRQGRVTVDGEVVSDPATSVDPETQDLKLDGEKLRMPRKRYYLLNKPKGVLCTNSDPQGRPRAVDLVPSNGNKLFTVGRLDESTEGLLLITNDGELAERMAHPRFEVVRRYRAHVAGIPNDETLQQLREGMYFSDGFFRFRGVRILKRKGRSVLLELEMKEGKNREIRRLLAKVGHKVIALERIAFGPLRIGHIPPGRFRELRNEEVNELKKALMEAGREEFGDRRRPGERPRRGASAGRRRPSTRPNADSQNPDFTPSNPDRSSANRDRSATSRDRSAASRERSAASRDRSATPRDRSAAGDRSMSSRDRSSSIRDRSSTSRDRSPNARDRSATGTERSSTRNESSTARRHPAISDGGMATDRTADTRPERRPAAGRKPATGNRRPQRPERDDSRPSRPASRRSESNQVPTERPRRTRHEGQVQESSRSSDRGQNENRFERQSGQPKRRPVTKGKRRPVTRTGTKKKPPAEKGRDRRR